MKLINMTAHEVRILGVNGEIILPRATNAARLRTYNSPRRMVTDDNGITFFLQDERYTNETIPGLPPEQEGTYYIVSRTFAQEFRGKRNDLLVVAGVDRSGDTVYGCRGFARLI